MKILFLGLGNPILSDDAVGIKVVEEIKRILGKRDGIYFDTGNINSLHILDAIQGYGKVVIVDAVKKGGEPGTLYHIPLEELQATIHHTSLHTINLATAIRLGKEISKDMPEEISIYGVEVKDIENFSEELTEEVKRAISGIAQEIMRKEIK